MAKTKENPGEQTNEPGAQQPSGEAAKTISGINEAAGVQDKAQEQATRESTNVANAERLNQTPTPVQSREPLQQQAPANLGPKPEKSLEDVYGPDYVTATRQTKGGDPETGYFTAQAWKSLDGDKGGWKKQVKTPPEVEELQAKKAAE